MINLLQTPLPAEAIARVLAEVKERRPLLPPLGDPVWGRARATPIGAMVLERIRPLAQQECQRALPPLGPELYGDYGVSGNRLRFEAVYFERRRQLARAAVCALLEPDAGQRQGWLASVVAKTADLLAEPAWCLPAHSRQASGIDPEGVDLFAAETANLLGELVTLFGDQLPPDLVSQARERVHRSILVPYLANADGMAWTRATTNWNAVCHQGVLGSALALEPSGDRLAELMALTAQRLVRFLEGFAADGGCSEGITYWDYGFGWFALLNEQLERFSAGALSLIEGCEQVARIAAYGPSQLLSGGQLVNFSDARLDMPPRASLMAYLGQRLGNDRCRRAASRLAGTLLRQGLDVSFQRCDLLFLTRLLLAAPDLAAEEGPEEGDDHLPASALVVARSRDRRGRLWELAAKGGHNAEHHNHNDCGSYLFNLDGERVVAEIGAPEYTRTTFGADRYTLLATRSRGHSLPVVGGHEQFAGERARSTVLACTSSEGGLSFELQLALCYPPEAGCSSLVRTIEFERHAGVLRICDRFELSRVAPLETATILAVPAERQGEGASAQVGTQLVRFEPLGQCRLGAIEALSYSGHTGSIERIWRLVWVPLEAAREGSIGLEITAA